MAKYVPSELVVRTPLDEMGSLLDIPRIPGEELKKYSKRLYDTYINRASSTYEGLINGINRELGLEREPVISVDLRYIGAGEIDDIDVTVTSQTITNNLSYTNLINGASVVAVGNKLTDTTQNWTEGFLRGLKLKINTEIYEIIDNTSDSVLIKEELTSLIGSTYLIEADYEDNILIGLGLRKGNRLYKISANSSKIIKINDGDLFDSIEDIYKVTAFNPKIEVTASRMNLYREYTNSENFQIEASIDLREDVKFHRDIVGIINTLTYFEAEDLVEIKRDIFAFAIKRQTSEHIVIQENVPVARFFRFENPALKEGSVKFTEATVFLRESPEDLVSQEVGNYNIDYTNGIVTVNTLPSGNGTASYTWNEFPFSLIYSPVIVNALTNESTQEFLFNQIEMKLYTSFKDKHISGQPKADMIEYIAELLAVKPQNWGE